MTMPESILQIKELRKFAKDIQNLKEKYDETIQDSRVDKFDFGFNKDDRFQCMQSIRIWLTAYTGVYGTSSCSTFVRVDKNKAHKYFIQALNHHVEEILHTMGEFAIEDALDLQKEAQKELAEFEKIIKENS